MAFEQGSQESSTLEDAADFLLEVEQGDDNPDDGADADEERGDTNDDDAPSDGQGDDDTGDDDDADDESPADADDEDDDGKKNAKPTSSDLTVKVKVPVKGEDGAPDGFKEVTLKELVDGNMMREDYTRKTQELSARERQASEVMGQRLTEGLNYYKQQAQFAMQAVMQLADLKDEAAMFQLSRQLTPEQFQQEQQRQAYVRAQLGQIGQTMQRDEQAHMAELTRQQEDARKSAMQSCWGVLGHHKINGDTVRGAFEHAIKHYGVPQERFQNISDPALVRIMVSAMKWDQAEAKSKTVQKETRKAPNLGAAQRQQPPQRREDKRLNDKFKSGRAGVKDLAEALYRDEQRARRGRGRG